MTRMPDTPATSADGPVDPLIGDYPAIGDYAIVGDCRTTALISRQGAVEWMCLPAISSPSLFAAMLDRRRGGILAVRPRGVERIERAYIDHTNVLQTRYFCTHGMVEVTDCMPLVIEPQRQLALEPTRELLRRLVCQSGRVEVDILYQPRPDYGRHVPRLDDRGRLGLALQYDGNLYVLLSDMPLERTGPHHTEARGTAVLREGDRRFLSLTNSSLDVGVIASLGRDADKRIDQTAHWWHDWCRRAQYAGRHAKTIQRSLLTLKLMSYAPSGALIGAPTTSLPESIGGDRNWDYRYCWPRDATLTVRALTELGFPGEARSFIGWLLHTTRLTRPHLLPLYDIYGRPAPREEILPHLEGYRGSGPVRIGNGANNQLQLDIYGAVIVAAYDFLEGGGELTPQEWKLICAFANEVMESWDQPDNGIWEVRGERRHHTYSKLMCWVALDSLLRLYDRHGLRIDVKGVRACRNAIREAIDRRAWNRDLQSYVSVFDGDQADASLLLMARLGYLEPHDPRMTGTLRFIERELDVNGFVLRYRHGQDPHSGAEGAFGICSFWRIDLLALRGELQRAEHLFDKLVATANDVGLMAEEVDTGTGELLGNFPQAFTHIGLSMAALAIERTRQHKDARDVGREEKT